MIVGIFPLWNGRFWGGAEVTRFVIDIVNYEKARLRNRAVRSAMRPEHFDAARAFLTRTGEDDG